MGYWLLHSARVARTEGFVLDMERSSLFAPAGVVVATMDDYPVR
jgi:hypothetical protein